MNIIFALVFLLCALCLSVFSPENFLSALLDGATKSASVCCALLATYSVWLGLMRVWEDSGVARGVSKLLKKPVKRLLKTSDEQALNAVCMNVSVNLLGISGAATPYGIEGAKRLDKTNNAEYSSAMLFVLNATSLQIFPASMIALRTSMHSAAPADILLPTLLATTASTCLGVFLVRLLLSPNPARLQPKKKVYFCKRKGAGMR